MKTTAGVTYTYDGDGRRVMKSNGKLYWYGAGSSVLMETDLSGNLQDEYIYFNGQRTARRTSAGVVYYFLSDHLGTNRIVTNATGGVVEDSDFFPFGAERVVTDTLNNNYKFTGHERDGESGLDYMVARHYAFTLGRFLQPDAPFADQSPANPQTWNLYSYARNNPLYFVDPTGRGSGPWSGPMGERLPSRGGWGNVFGLADDGTPRMEYGWSGGWPGSSVNSGSDANTATSEDVEAQENEDTEAMDRARGTLKALLNILIGVVNLQNFLLGGPESAEIPYLEPNTSAERQGMLSTEISLQFMPTPLAVEGGAAPSLRFLHTSHTLRPSTLNYLRKLSTEEIVASLRPGSREALRVRPDGTVLNGHHRLTVLRERAVDINALPREIVPKEHIFDRLKP